MWPSVAIGARSSSVMLVTGWNRCSASTNERMRPPLSATRSNRSPCTGDPVRLPLLEGFKPTRSVLGDIASDDDVSDDRPCFAGRSRSVDTTQASQSHRGDSERARSRSRVSSDPVPSPCYPQGGRIGDIEVRGWSPSAMSGMPQATAASELVSAQPV